MVILGSMDFVITEDDMMLDYASLKKVDMCTLL